jgi:phage regulator Rha-like protein
MDKQRWEEIESILDEALAFADQQKQNEVIKKACEHNQQLYNQVSALLTSIREAKATNFLEEH